MSQINSILLPVTYLGPVSYFAHLVQAPRVIIEMHEHYVKQTYRNRCRILTANGELDLIIPVVKVNGHHTRISEIAMAYSEKWHVNHWRAIESAYSSAPYFLFYRDDIEPFFDSRFMRLSDFNTALLKVLLALIGIQKELHFTRRYVPEIGLEKLDLRSSFDPKRSTTVGFPAYTHVFSEKWGFHPDLSIIDLLFNLGPASRDYLLNIAL